MGKSEKQKALDKELLRECQGYTTRDIKPDGAYIQEGGWFFNLNKIKRLIASGADVRAKDRNGYTPLHLAIRSDNIEIAKLLIVSGADVRAYSDNGFTPLHSAVYCDNIEIAKLLIDSGANVEAKDCSLGRTPSQWAWDQSWGRKSWEMIDLLKKHGAK